MTNPRSDNPQFLLFLVGAAILMVLAIASLPHFPEALRAPSTPFDRSIAPGAAADYKLLQETASFVPSGASVAALSQPRNAIRETSLHRVAIALLPGRRVLPAALWNTPTHLEDQADFLIVSGGKPASPPGTLLLETPRGSVWQRGHP
jgi:hypothetical protein